MFYDLLVTSHRKSFINGSSFVFGMHKKNVYVAFLSGFSSNPFEIIAKLREEIF